MMKDVNMREMERPINLQEIREFEQLIDAKLPEDYIEHLLKYNGGRPDKEDCYDFIEPIDEKELYGGIHYFYALYEGDICNLVKEYQSFIGRIPHEMIPIAAVGSESNQICLGISGNYYGKIYYWVSDWESDEEGVPVYDNIYLIANSFTEFINKLYIHEIELLDGKWVHKKFDKINGVLVPHIVPSYKGG